MHRQVPIATENSFGTYFTLEEMSDFQTPSRRRSIVPVPTKSELVAKRLAASAGILPGSVGPFIGLLVEGIQGKYDKRVRDFQRDVEDRLTMLEADFDSLADSEEFQSLFARTMMQLLQEHSEEKLAAFRNILVNAVVAPVDWSIQELFFSLTTRLTTAGISLLRDMTSPEPLSVRIGRPRKEQVTFGEIWSVLLPTVPKHIILRNMAVLVREELVADHSTGFDRHTALNDNELRSLMLTFGNQYVQFALLTGEHSA